MSNAGGYIINKRVVRAVLAAYLPARPAAGGIELDIIAGTHMYNGSTSTCLPRQCCTGGAFTSKPPCVRANKGIAEGRLLYGMAASKSYIATTPILCYRGWAEACDRFNRNFYSMFMGKTEA